MSKQTIVLIPLICIYTVLASSYDIRLSDDGPIVKGATIHIFVAVYEGYNLSTDKFKYEWEDNGIPQHTRETDMQNATDMWAVTYDARQYPLGNYLAQVKVKYCMFSLMCYEVGSARIAYRITGLLNGNVTLTQNNNTRENDFVSNKDTVIHQVDLKKSDADYISMAPTVRTYWFVDCVYYGFSTDLQFPFNYTKPDEEHLLEILVVADFTPIPPTTTVAPTTTTTPTTTTSKPTTTTVVPTTTLKPNNTMAATVKPDTSTMAVNGSKSLVRRSVLRDSSGGKNSSGIMAYVNGTLVPFNLTLPYICNGSQVMTDSNKTYGFFYKRVKVKAPISNVNVTGNNWIKHGDLLTLQVSCSGSKSIYYCVEIFYGDHNITANDTCKEYTYLDTCDFRIKRYLPGDKYTLLISIKNDVAKVVTPVVVTMYKVKQQAQLSVIVVPVAFSLVAVVLIVFGVAYYIQNRSRFVIEVADFNFGQRYSDMEYKTFRERLKDSIMNAFTRGPSPSSSEVPVWPPGRK